MPYILEVQKFFVDGHNIHPEWNGKKEHIGYMNKIFRTKQEASDYYHEHNKDMRVINSENHWCSDWDPNTSLLYVVREYTGEYLKISPFS
jgi:hypothetical protein